MDPTNKLSSDLTLQQNNKFHYVVDGDNAHDNAIKLNLITCVSQFSKYSPSFVTIKCQNLQY